MRGARLALVLAAVVSVATGTAAAATNYAQESLDRYFRIEYQVEPSVARPDHTSGGCDGARYCAAGRVVGS